MNVKPHPAQLLFTEKHPLTAELDMKFIPESEHVLRVEVVAPRSFADHTGKNVHSGFATLILDTVLGSCAIGNLEKMQPIATIKLTCNHLRRIGVGTPLYCRAIWNGEENTISHISGEIRRIEDDTLMSTALGTFMVGTASRPLSEKQNA